MSIASRIALYKKIESIRGRPLIVYVTSSRVNATGRMGIDVIPEICDQINALPSDQNKVDLLIVSKGGDSMVAWRTISMLREKVTEISVLVPYTAYSAATLLALGADEIIMHPFANLGPIDPQISISKKRQDGHSENMNFGSEDMEGFFDFARRKVGLSDQGNMLEVFKLFCSEVGPIPIGLATRSSQLAQQLGVKLLQARHRKRPDPDGRKAKPIVDRLNKQYFNHGYALSRSEAREIGLKVVYPPPKLEQAMWELWQEVEKDLKEREPFDPMSMVAKDPTMKPVLASPPTLCLPPNTPPPMAQQIWEAVLIKSVVESPKMTYNKPCALLESTQLQKMFIEKGEIAAVKSPKGLNLNVTITSFNWCDSVDQAT